jgi:hypothetical protein
VRFRNACDSLRDQNSSIETLFYNDLFDEYRAARTCVVRDRTTCEAKTSAANAFHRSWRSLAILDGKLAAEGDRGAMRVKKTRGSEDHAALARRATVRRVVSIGGVKNDG